MSVKNLELFHMSIIGSKFVHFLTDSEDIRQNYTFSLSSYFSIDIKFGALFCSTVKTHHTTVKLGLKSRGSKEGLFLYGNSLFEPIKLIFEKSYLC